MKVFKMIILSLLVSCATWNEFAKQSFCLLSKQKLPKSDLNFWIRLIDKSNLAV